MFVANKSLMWIVFAIVSTNDCIVYWLIYASTALEIAPNLESRINADYIHHGSVLDILWSDHSEALSGVIHLIE